MPCLTASLGSPNMHSLAMNIDFSGINGVSTKDGSSHFGSPGPDGGRRKTENLPLAQLEADVMNNATAGKVLYL